MSFLELGNDTVYISGLDKNWWEEKKKEDLKERENSKWVMMNEIGVISVIEEDCDYMFKVLVVGDSAVGKTCLTRRYCERNFSPHYLFTIGVDFKSKILEVDGEKCLLQIWDTAGQERFRTITNSYYRGAHGVVVCFDVTNSLSFQNVPQWLEEIEKNATGPLPERIIVGNKADLKDVQMVEWKTAKDYAKFLNIPLFQVSAKSGIGVERAFTALADQMLNAKRRALQDSCVTYKEVDSRGLDDSPWVFMTADPRHALEVPNRKPPSTFESHFRNCCRT